MARSTKAKPKPAKKAKPLSLFGLAFETAVAAAMATGKPPPENQWRKPAARKKIARAKPSQKHTKLEKRP